MFYLFSSSFEKSRLHQKRKMVLSVQEPIDPMLLNIPDYHEIIKKPMDLKVCFFSFRSSKHDHFLIDFREKLLES